MKTTGRQIIRRLQLVFILCALVALWAVHRHGQTRLAESDAQLADARTEFGALVSERDRVFAEKDYLNSDIFFERVLRRHGMVRPGETLFVIVNE